MTQALPNLVYALLLAAALLTPYAAFYIRPEAFRRRSPLWLAAAAIFAIAFILISARHGHFSLLSIALILPLIGAGTGALLGGAAAILIFAPTIWWRDSLEIGPPIAAGLFIMLALGAELLPRLGASEGAPAGNARAPSILLPMIICAIIGALVGLVTIPLGSLEPLGIAWHHWGAFLSPVDAWLSGGVPYRDFPVQYGLGPTTLLAAVCSTDCWRGMYWTALSANALYFATLAGVTMLLSWRQSRGIRWLALLALFCACFIWTGFPVNFGTAVMTPSVAGMRFLPISAMLLHILTAENRSAEGRPVRDWIGHLIWLADLFWSPETAFFGTLIWWPYLTMRAAAKKTDTPAGPILALVRGALFGAVALAIGSATLVVIVWLVSARTLTADAFFAYIKHPPGPLPANPVGTIWLALAAIILATAVLTNRRLSSSARTLHACLLGFLAAGAYYLSRSHDNNILNLFPLMIPVLVATLAGMAPVDGTAANEDPGALSFGRAFILTTLAAMVAFTATFNFDAWSDGVARNGLFQFGPDRLVARFAPQAGDNPRTLKPDALAALDYARSRNADGGKILLASKAMLMLWSPPGKDWTTVNNFANFEPLPDPVIIHYLKRGAAVYHRPGWLLVSRPQFDRWITLFKTAYDVREEKQFGTYTAYYLVPR